MNCTELELEDSGSQARLLEESGLNSRICGETAYSGIMAGGANVICENYASFIGGGDHNSIVPGGGTTYTAYRSFIGGGFENCIQDINAVIAGGIANSILMGASEGVIAGGANNTISGACSSILGGHNNNDGGLANAHIVGSGVALGAGVGNANSLHVNGLWANGMPVFPAGFPYNVGTVFVVPVGTPPPAGIAGALYIM